MSENIYDLSEVRKEGGTRAQATSAASAEKSPLGRTLANFRNLKTESGLLPAETRLLESVAKGEELVLTPYAVGHTLEEQLRSAVSDTEILKLAAEVATSPQRIFHKRHEETKKEEKERLELEARVRATTRAVQELLEELSTGQVEGSTSHEELRARLNGDPKQLKAIIFDLTNKLTSQFLRWRKVDPNDPQVRVRGEFLRFLALGGDEVAYVHEAGVQLYGAFIEGRFDLAYCTGVRPLRLKNSRCSHSLHLEASRLRELNLSGSCVREVQGVGLIAEDSIFFDRGFLALGPVNLTGLRLGGSLDCRGGSFRSGFDCINCKIGRDIYLSDGFKSSGAVSFEGAAIDGSVWCNGGTFEDLGVDETVLDFENSKIKGHVRLCDGFSAKGQTSFFGAEIGGALRCNGGHFLNSSADGEAVALNLQRTKVGGTVFFTNQFVAEGQISMIGAEVKGFLACCGGKFKNLVPAPVWTGNGRKSRARRAALSLDLSNVTIGDGLWLAANKNESSAAEIAGSIELSDAHARLLIDRGGWPKRRIKGADGRKLNCVIVLDGFTYDRLAEGAPTNAEERGLWLRQQPEEHLYSDFRPQPFEQLTKVLREMGHEADAKGITIEKLRMRRSAKWSIIQRNLIRPPRNWFRWIVEPLSIAFSLFAAVGLFFEWLIVDGFLGNGYAKLRPLLFFLVMLGGCGWFYDRAAQQGAFVPSNPALYGNSEIRKACTGDEQTPNITKPIDWYRCKKAPPELSPFRPLIYSVDVMIPVIQLGQKRDWQPTSQELHFEVPGLGQVTFPALTTIFVTWFETISSYVLYGLLGAILGGLIKRD